MKTVYLHIGAHKTATSSIQYGLMMSRENLLSQGIFFPLLPSPNLIPTQNHSAFFFSLFGDDPEHYHINIAEGMTQRGAINHLHNRYKKFLIDETERVKFEAIVFSGEDMVLLSKDGVDNLHAFLKDQFGSDCAVKVICYIRAPQDWFSSLVQQWVQGGAVLDDLFGRNFPSIRERIEPFCETFGVENIVICKFEDAIQHENGPIGHFLERISAKIDVSAAANVLQNKRLSAEAVHLLSALNKFESCSGANIVDGVARDYLEPFFNIQGTRFVLPEPVQERAWNTAREGLRWIESTFGINTYAKPERSEQPAAMWGEEAILSIAKLVRHENDRNV